MSTKNNHKVKINEIPQGEVKLKVSDRSWATVIFIMVVALVIFIYANKIAGLVIAALAIALCFMKANIYFIGYEDSFVIYDCEEKDYATLINFKDVRTWKYVMNLHETKMCITCKNGDYHEIKEGADASMNAYFKKRAPQKEADPNHVSSEDIKNAAKIKSKH
ncbi:MAG: hypothetical protein Q4D13_05435 [Erysipelotrichaceae bacterium]|nr:hypothetical protein [Erysipelotrichaceae bacterium]